LNAKNTPEVDCSGQFSRADHLHIRVVPASLRQQQGLDRPPAGVGVWSTSTPGKKRRWPAAAAPTPHKATGHKGGPPKTYHRRRTPLVAKTLPGGGRFRSEHRAAHHIRRAAPGQIRPEAPPADPRGRRRRHPAPSFRHGWPPKRGRPADRSTTVHDSPSTRVWAGVGPHVRQTGSVGQRRIAVVAFQRAAC